MNGFLFLPHYIRWHYTRGVRDLATNVFGMLLAVADFFAFESLFSSWKTSFIDVFLGLFGFCILVCGMLMSLAVFVIWILYPLIIVALVANAIIYLF